MDFEAMPLIDKDNPPDLKKYADAAVPLAVDDAAAPAAPAAAAAVTGGSTKGDKVAAEKKEAAAVGPKQPRAHDVLRITDELVAKVR